MEIIVTGGMYETCPIGGHVTIFDHAHTVMHAHPHTKHPRHLSFETVAAVTLLRMMSKCTKRKKKRAKGFGRRPLRTAGGRGNHTGEVSST